MMFFVGHLFMVACEQEWIKAKRRNGKMGKRVKRQKNTGRTCSPFLPLYHFPFVLYSNSPFTLFAVSPTQTAEQAILAV